MLIFYIGPEARNREKKKKEKTTGPQAPKSINGQLNDNPEILSCGQNEVLNPKPYTEVLNLKPQPTQNIKLLRLVEPYVCYRSIIPIG